MATEVKVVLVIMQIEVYDLALQNDKGNEEAEQKHKWQRISKQDDNV